jgi:hypothetical protein
MAIPSPDIANHFVICIDDREGNLLQLSFISSKMDFHNTESSYHDLDKWIEKLNNCKPLTEVEVKALCDMV